MKHEFAAGQKAMFRIGSDVYAVTIESVTPTTATADGRRFHLGRGKLRRASGYLFALPEGDEWVDRLDPCF